MPKVILDVRVRLRSDERKILYFLPTHVCFICIGMAQLPNATPCVSLQYWRRNLGTVALQEATRLDVRSPVHRGPRWRGKDAMKQCTLITIRVKTLVLNVYSVVPLTLRI